MIQHIQAQDTSVLGPVVAEIAERCRCESRKG